MLRFQVVALNRGGLKLFFDYGGVVQAEVSAYRLLSFSILSTGEFVNVGGHRIDPCFGKIRPRRLLVVGLQRLSCETC